MLNSGDVVDLDLGPPEGREAGFRHPAVIVSAQRVLDGGPTVIQIVPMTSTVRNFGSEVDIRADIDNGLTQHSVAQCQHIRAISPNRVLAVRGNVGNLVVRQIRETLAVLLDL